MTVAIDVAVPNIGQKCVPRKVLCEIFVATLKKFVSKRKQEIVYKLLRECMIMIH